MTNENVLIRSSDDTGAAECMQLGSVLLPVNNANLSAQG